MLFFDIRIIFYQLHRICNQTITRAKEVAAIKFTLRDSISLATPPLIEPT